jgi:hypothetical protein
MSQQAIDRYVAALTRGDGLHDDFIYSMPWKDCTNFPDPFARTVFTVDRRPQAHALWPCREP